MTQPRIAYLTTAYPYVSHTFIRREILGLERLGYRVTSVSIRAGDAIVDAEDVAENAKSLHFGRTAGGEAGPTASAREAEARRA